MNRPFRPRFQFRLWMLFAAIALIAVGLACLPVAKWVGGFDLTLTIESASQKPIAVVSYCVSLDRISAEFCLQQPDNAECHFRPCEQHEGLYYAYIRSYGTDTYFGRTLDYNYERFLVLKVEFADGRQALQLIEVPEEQGSRSFTVEVP